MKKYLAVFGLGTGRSLIKILIGALLLMALDAGLFYYALGHEPGDFAFVIGRSHMSWAFLVISIGFTLSSVLTWRAKNKTNYTYSNLKVSEGKAFLTTALAGTVVYLFYWFLQVIIVYACYKYYMNCFGDGEFDLGIFTLFHQDPFLVSLFPMGVTIRWLLTIGRALMVGAGCASLEHNKLAPIGSLTIMFTAISIVTDACGANFPYVQVFFGMVCAVAVLVIGGLGRRFSKFDDAEGGADR